MLSSFQHGEAFKYSGFNIFHAQSLHVCTFSNIKSPNCYLNFYIFAFFFSKKNLCSLFFLKKGFSRPPSPKESNEQRWTDETFALQNLRDEILMNYLSIYICYANISFLTNLFIKSVYLFIYYFSSKKICRCLFKQKKQWIKIQFKFQFQRCANCLIHFLSFAFQSHPKLLRSRMLSYTRNSVCVPILRSCENRFWEICVNISVYFSFHFIFKVKFNVQSLACGESLKLYRS